MWGSVGRNGNVGPCYRRPPPFIWCKSIWGCSHELVAPSDHDVFVGRFVTIFSSGNFILKPIFLFYRFGFLLMYFSEFFF
jgi:hypothetical protein